MRESRYCRYVVAVADVARLRWDKCAAVCQKFWLQQIPHSNNVGWPSDDLNRGGR
jgi:hypothetical protein